jgi:hypothetical protein
MLIKEYEELKIEQEADRLERISQHIKPAIAWLEQ